jgi:hypothetical protein
MSTSTAAFSGQPRPGNPFLVIERILRHRDDVWRQIGQEQRIGELLSQMLTSSTLSLACYGVVMGLWQFSPLQALASAIKLPLLFLLTLAICLPTLYLFNLVLGSTLSVRQALALVMTSITVTSVLTLAFAPISLFFLLTASDYEFFKLLNVAILGLTGFVGLGFLVDGVASLNHPSPEAASGPPPPPPPVAEDEAAKPAAQAKKANTPLVWLWIVLYGFVGTQLAWTLRPFFGDPNQPFQIFRFGSNNSNFYVNMVLTIGNLFG